MKTLKVKKPKGKITNLNLIVAPIYREIVLAVARNEYKEVVLRGGRGSAKSSLAALLAVLTVLSGKGNALCVRRYAITLRGSCYNDIQVAIDRLGVADEFEARLSPMEFRHIPTGFVIAFRGLDDPTKLKSIRMQKGTIELLWFEECSEIEGYAKCRNVRYSAGRGEGARLVTVYTYNPPSSQHAWVNKELNKPTRNRYVLKTSYLDIPARWLGSDFIAGANELKETNEIAYRNEFLGDEVGQEGQIFKNLKPLPKNDIEWEKLYRGLDFGYKKDPSAYTVWAYSKRSHSIYAIAEFYGHGMKVKTLAFEVKKENKHNYTVKCDCQEARTIDELVDHGVTRAIGCKKGKDSVRHGLQWLQGLNAIYIDPYKTPNIYREFYGYEYPTDKRTGETVNEYPDEDNHTIDSTRYALEDAILGYVV
jgi:phage terminase large subunit